MTEWTIGSSTLSEEVGIKTAECTIGEDFRQKRSRSHRQSVAS